MIKGEKEITSEKPLTELTIKAQNNMIINTQAIISLASFSPYYRDYYIIIEYKQLAKLVPNGIYVLPQFDTLYVWHGVMFLRQGIYKTAILKFIINLPPNYPDSRPSVQFSSKVFHPLVDYETGLVDLNKVYPSWNKNANHIWDLLAFVKKIFYQVEETAKQYTILNQLAFDLLQNNKKEFKHKVDECVKMSIDNMHTNAPQSSVIFSADKYGLYTNLRSKILMKQKNDSTLSFLGWITQGVTQGMTQFINIKY